MEIRERLWRIAQDIERALEPPMPDVSVGTLSAATLWQLMADSGISPINPNNPSDTQFACTDRAGWQEVIWRAIQNGRLYVAEFDDCDDIADAAKTDIVRYIRPRNYPLNGRRMVYGQSDYGYHSYLVLPSWRPEEEPLIFEPSSSFGPDPLMDIGDRGYIPEFYFR